jgi:predicted HicB family RNase H-like nuclease
MMDTKQQEAQSVPEEPDVHMIVHVPRSLQAALQEKAEREGMSLNQLVVAKLSLPLSHLLSAQLAP